MKIKFSWILSFCLVAIISIFNCSSVHASSGSSASGSVTSSTVSDFSNYGILNSYTNIVEIKFCFTDSGTYKEYHQYIFSNGSIVVTSLNLSKAEIIVSCKSPHGYLIDTTLKNSNGSTSYGISWNDSVSSTIDGQSVIASYVTGISGDVYNIRGNNFKLGGTIPLDNSPSLAHTNPTDVLNFNWDGNGIKIYNLTENMNVSGYQDTSGLKYFDIETYGKFTYTGSDTLFTTFAYKKMQTSIQLASILTYGTQTRRTGEGLGIKSFEWLSDTSHLNKGDIVKFRIVYQAPMLDKGSYDISIGTTINDGTSDSWIKDTVFKVNFLNANADTGNFNNTGETGNVGSQPGNIPQGADTSVNGNLTSMVTMFSSFSSFIGALFGFLPDQVKILFISVCILITGLMVKRAVL